MNTLAALAVACALSLGAGLWTGIEWQQGRSAILLEEARAKMKEQSDAADKVALDHTAVVTQLNRQLGNTRAQLYGLTSGRDCLSARAVRLLNGGPASVPTPAGEPAGAPDAAATDRDVGDALAICRSEHARLAAQLNAILDIEDSRH